MGLEETEIAAPGTDTRPIIKEHRADGGRIHIDWKKGGADAIGIWGSA